MKHGTCTYEKFHQIRRYYNHSDNLDVCGTVDFGYKGLPIFGPLLSKMCVISVNYKGHLDIRDLLTRFLAVSYIRRLLYNTVYTDEQERTTAAATDGAANIGSLR